MRRHWLLRTSALSLGGQASDTALETADVVIMSPDLAKVPSWCRLGPPLPATFETEHRLRLLSKLAVMLLAVAGLATMWMAVAADVGASMIVIANGLRMIRSGKGRRQKAESRIKPLAA